jgi:mannose-6-phosphate isomerase-like protein (cupin superfamily)
VPIEFLDLLGDGGWEPLAPDADAPGARWSEGGALGDAPVDLAATFGGAVWRATRIDPTFGLTGIRLREGFRVPLHHHDHALVLIVFAGSCTVATELGCGSAESADHAAVHESAAEGAELGAGQFCVIDAGTAYSLAAGSEGATFLASWAQGAESPVTCWHPDPGWARAEAGAIV